MVTSPPAAGRAGPPEAASADRPGLQSGLAATARTVSSCPPAGAGNELQPAAPADGDLARAVAIAAAVPDPEIPVVTLADLGILRGAHRRHDGLIVVALTPTYTGCPATLAIRLDVEAALREAGLPDALVEIVLSPPWSTDDITDAGRRKLQDFGIAPPPGRHGRGALLFDSEPVACPRCGSQHTSRISEFGSTPCKALWRCEACREPFDLFKCL